jgi:hypothetical protein
MTRELANIHDPLQGPIPMEASLFMRIIKIAMLNCFRLHACIEFVTNGDNVDKTLTTDSLARRMHRLSFEQFLLKVMNKLGDLAIRRGVYSRAVMRGDDLQLPPQFGSLSRSGQLSFFNSDEGIVFRVPLLCLPFPVALNAHALIVQIVDRIYVAMQER